MRGKHIVLEGMDNSGKTTLAKELHQQLEHLGRNPRGVHFPSEGVIGRLIRQVLAGELRVEHKALLYLFTADGVDQRAVIDDMLNQGHDVICDRHPCLSGWVYQRQEHPLCSIEAVHQTAPLAGYDGLFVIDMPAQFALERQRHRRKYLDVVYEYDDEDPEALLRTRTLRELYLQLAENHGATVLDGRCRTDELARQIIEEMNL